jgi:protein SCO1
LVLRWRACLLVMGVLLAAVALATAPPRLVVTGPVTALLPPKPVADFTLTDARGKPFPWRQLRGAPVLVFFGFAQCPDVCPRAMQQLQALTEMREPSLKGARMLMISVDGDRDGPAELRAWLKDLSPAFLALTGKPADVKPVAAEFSAAFFKGLPLDKSGRYEIQHTSRVYLVDDRGHLLASFDDAPVDVMRDTARRLLPSKR